jgi:hypothetical protein
MAARNMQRIEINIYKKELCVKLVIYKDCTEMHGQQNIKVWLLCFVDRAALYNLVNKANLVHSFP